LKKRYPTPRNDTALSWSRHPGPGKKDQQLTVGGEKIVGIHKSPKQTLRQEGGEGGVRGGGSMGKRGGGGVGHTKTYLRGGGRGKGGKVEGDDTGLPRTSFPVRVEGIKRESRD